MGDLAVAMHARVNGYVKYLFPIEGSSGEVEVDLAGDSAIPVYNNSDEETYTGTLNEENAMNEAVDASNSLEVLSTALECSPDTIEDPASNATTSQAMSERYADFTEKLKNRIQLGYDRLKGYIDNV